MLTVFPVVMQGKKILLGGLQCTNYQLSLNEPKFPDTNQEKKIRKPIF